MKEKRFEIYINIISTNVVIDQPLRLKETNEFKLSSRQVLREKFKQLKIQNSKDIIVKSYGIMGKMVEDWWYLFLELPWDKNGNIKKSNSVDITKLFKRREKMKT